MLFTLKTQFTLVMKYWYMYHYFPKLNIWMDIFIHARYGYLH